MAIDKEKYNLVELFKNSTLKLNKTDFWYDLFLYQLAQQILSDLHKGNIEQIQQITNEEIARVKEDLHFRLEKMLPSLLVTQNLFTVDMLLMAKINVPKLSKWQKVKLFLQIILK